MYSTKLKKQLSLVVFLPFLLVNSYNANIFDNSVIPLYFMSSIMTENEVEYTYTIKKINSLKNLINNLISQLTKVVKSFVNKASFKATLTEVIVGETAIVLNRGSPVVYC